MQQTSPNLYQFPLPEEFEGVDFVELAETALARLGGNLTATKLQPSKTLSHEDNIVYVKRADELPGRCFKYLSAMNAVVAATEAGETAYVFATAGSYGIGVGHAIRHYGGRAIAYVPEGTNPQKQAAMRDLGVEVREEGKVIEDSLCLAGKLAAEENLRLLHPFASKEAIGGVAIMGLEIVKQCPDVTHLALQYGGGSLSSGVAGVLKRLIPGLQLTIAQGAGCTSFVDSIRTGEPTVSEAADIRWGGLAVSQTHPFTLGLVSRLVDATTVVELLPAHATMHDYKQETGVLPELAAAVGLEAGRNLARSDKTPKGAKIVTVLSGANPDSVRTDYLAARSRRRAKDIDCVRSFC